MEGFGLILGHLLGDYVIQNDWMAANKTKNTLACIVHCTLYTLAVWACSFWWMPWWGLLVCWMLHFPVDRFRLAGWWMRNIAGQTVFATGGLSPWSIIVVDNTYHLLCLWTIGLLAGRT